MFSSKIIKGRIYNQLDENQGMEQSKVSERLFNNRLNIYS